MTNIARVFSERRRSLFLKMFRSDKMLGFYMLDPNITQIICKLLNFGYFNEVIDLTRLFPTLKEDVLASGQFKTTSLRDKFYALLKEFLDN